MLKRHISKSGVFSSKWVATEVFEYTITLAEIDIVLNKKYSIINFNLSIGEGKILTPQSAFFTNLLAFRFFLTENSALEYLENIVNGNYGLLNYRYNNILNNQNIFMDTSDILDSSNSNLNILRMQFDAPNDRWNKDFTKIKTKTIHESIPTMSNVSVYSGGIRETDLKINNNIDFYFESRYSDKIGFTFFPHVNGENPAIFDFAYNVNFDLIEEDF